MLWILAFVLLITASVYLVGYGAYHLSPRYRHWVDDKIIFAAMANGRKGAWVDNAHYWAFVSPKDRVSPRGGGKVPAFDLPNYQAPPPPSGLRMRGAKKVVDGAVPLLVPISK